MPDPGPRQRGQALGRREAAGTRNHREGHREAGGGRGGPGDNIPDKTFAGAGVRVRELAEGQDGGEQDLQPVHLQQIQQMLTILI